MSKDKVSKAKDQQSTDDSVDIEETEIEQIEDTQEELSLEQQLKQTQEEAKKNLDIAMRTQAEMENLRRRHNKNLEAAHKFAMERFAKELLDVADSMELGLKASEQDGVSVKSLIEGMKLTQQQLMTIFNNLNIEVIDAKGTKFDPDFHEALTMVVNTELQPNTVQEVVQKGYTLNQRLLRASKVIVTKSE